MTEMINREYLRLDDGTRSPSEIIEQISMEHGLRYKTIVWALGEGVWNDGYEYEYEYAY